MWLPCHSSLCHVKHITASPLGPQLTGDTLPTSQRYIYCGDTWDYKTSFNPFHGKAEIQHQRIFFKTCVTNFKNSDTWNLSYELHFYRCFQLVSLYVCGTYCIDKHTGKIIHIISCCQIFSKLSALCSCWVGLLRYRYSCHEWSERNHEEK
jgi:hypothetical protein